jgi:hypothetical protein
VTKTATMCKESYAQVVEANVQETDDKLRG